MGTRVEQSNNELPRLVSLLASSLEKTVQKKTTTSDVSNTVFHGSKPPALSIKQYLERVFKYAKCSTSCFVVAYVYLERFCQRSCCCLTPLNIHRLLITSVMVAAKFLDDECYNNEYYARIGGVSREEMNRMEMKFLFSLDFRLNVTVESYISYCSQLEREGRGRDRDHYPAMVPTRLESRVLSQPPPLPRRLISTVAR
ncbi:CYCP3-1 [Linum grandiflorum]